MATHSSVLALRIPGTGEPGGVAQGRTRLKRLSSSSSRCVVLSHCGSDSHFPDDYSCRAPSLVLLTTCISLLPFCQAQQILSIMHFSQDLLLDLQVLV